MTYHVIICAPDDAETIAYHAARAQAAGLTELRTAPMVYLEWSAPAVQPPPDPPPPPWWHGLAADARVTPVRDGVPVMGSDRRQVIYRGVPMVRNMGAVLVVSRAPTEADKAAGWLQVFGDRPPFPGGLYVAAVDVGPG